MLEICFDTSSAASIKMLRAEQHINADNSVVFIPDDLSIGGIAPFSIDFRLKELSNLSVEIDERTFRSDYEAFFTAIENVKEARIWASSSGYEMAGLYITCYLLKEKLKTVHVCDASYFSEYKKFSTVVLDFPDDYLTLLSRERIVSIYSYAQKGKQILTENKALRVIEDGAVVSKDIDYFDRDIIKLIHDSNLDDMDICQAVIDSYQSRNKSFFRSDILLHRIEAIRRMKLI